MKVKLSKSQLGILIAVIVLCIALISGGAVCFVKDTTPVELFNEVVSSNDEKIIGKWQSTDNDALFAYEFFDDGTYKNHSFLGLNFNGNYEVKGNKLILKNPDLSKQLVYKIKLNDDELELKKVEEDGNKSEEEITNYKRVDRINLKTITDYINDMKNEKAEEDEKAKTEATSQAQ